MVTYYSQHNNGRGVKGFEFSSPSLKQYTVATVCSLSLLETVHCCDCLLSMHPILIGPIKAWI